MNLYLYLFSKGVLTDKFDKSALHNIRLSACVFAMVGIC